MEGASFKLDSTLEWYSKGVQQQQQSGKPGGHVLVAGMMPMSLPVAMPVHWANAMDFYGLNMYTNASNSPSPQAATPHSQSHGHGHALNVNGTLLNQYSLSESPKSSGASPIESLNSLSPHGQRLSSPHQQVPGSGNANHHPSSALSSTSNQASPPKSSSHQGASAKDALFDGKLTPSVLFYLLYTTAQ